MEQALLKLSRDIHSEWIQKFSDEQQSEWLTDTPEDIADTLSNFVCRNDNGYQIAKTLDEEFGLPVDEKLVEICSRFQKYLTPA